MNRTAKPLLPIHYDDYTAFALHTGALKRAYLGNAAGVIEVQANGNSTEHYGKVYIRFPENTDDNNATVLGQAVEASVSPNVNFTYKTNLPVLVRKIGANGGYRVVDVDEHAARNVGFNTHSLNPLNPANTQDWLRNMRDGRLFAPATQDVGSLYVSVEPFVYYFDGSLYDGGKPSSINLSSYMPGTLLERLVLVGERSYDGSIQIISGSTRTITTTKYALSDISPLTYQFDDYMMPIRAVKLADNESTVLEKDLHQDLRQFMNVPQPRGFPQSIRRHIAVLGNYQEFFHSLSIDSGVLQIDGLLVEV